MVGLAAPGAKIASGPHTPSIAQQDRIAGAAGEQPSPASKVDDHPGGVEYHPADTTAQRGGEHVCRVDLVTCRCFTTPITNRGWIERFDAGADKCGEVVFECGLVDDDVDQWVTLTDHARPGGRSEDRQQRIETTLSRGTIEKSWVHLVAPLGDAGLPVGAKFGVTELGEDLLDHRTGHDTTSTIEIDPFPDDADVRVATGVGSLMRGVGAIGVSECLPTLEHHGKLLKPQILSMPDEQRCRVGELIGAARVGKHPSEESNLR
jgi:hypothetical protein